MKKYNPNKIEKKWQKKWENQKNYNCKYSGSNKKAKYYILDMFPYPSGDGLHMGHTESYTASDIIYRYKRLRGFDVLHPQGFDSFGLPAENYAVKTGIHPKETTRKNTANYIRQMKMLGLGHDLNHLIYTSDPSYYKWTQWLFGKFFENGLVERKTDKINWCPSCNTGIANEQVEQGKCERCKTEIQQKEVPGWFFKITDFAEDLIKDLDKVDWPEATKKNQKNWIGKSVGAKIKFDILEKDFDKKEFVFLHAYGDSIQGSFWSELEKEIQKRGGKVVFKSNLPDTNSPKLDKQKEYVLNNYNFNENTVVVTHSLGSVLAMKLIPELNTKIDRLVMVAPPINAVDFVDKVKRPVLEEYCDWNFNFDKIKSSVNEITVLADKNDHILPVKQTREVANELDCEYILSEGENTHFNGDKEKAVEDAVFRKIEVFTTRPDTLFGATYLVLAPEHRLINNEKSRIKNWDEVVEYIEKAKNKTEMERMEAKEKTGVKLEGLVAINPVNGEEIPIFVADYVLSGYGTGAIMAVPAHDERDLEFAIHYNESLNDVERTQKNAEKIKIRPVVLKQADMSYSFVMGAEKLTQDNFEKIGVKMIEKTKDGYFKVKIPFDKIEKYKNLIKEKMTSGFWNEFSTKNSFYFIFKHRDGKIEELELNKDTNDIIDKYGMTFNDEKPKKEAENVYGWLAENQFYREILIHSDRGILINSGEFDGMDSEEAKKKITEFVGGEMTVNYRLRDWSISRQRYWGCPIPIVYSPEGKAKFVGEENLPWLLPEDVDFVPDGTAPLAKSKELKERVEKLFGKGWTPEVDTMDTFVDSSWYFLRYPDPENEKEFCAPEKLKRWLPVDLYIGGAEHTYMHLLYARFFVKAMHKMKLLEFDEPFMKLRHQGMVLDKDGAKMSKSKGNVINPNDMVEKFGADATRMYMMFAGPLEEDVVFKEEGVKGVYRFLEKVWRIFNEKELVECGAGECGDIAKTIPPLWHKTIKGVTEDIENLRFNTAISKLMIFINECSKHKTLPMSAMKGFLILLSPFAPHIAEELFALLSNNTPHFIDNANPPRSGKKTIKRSNVNCIIKHWKDDKVLMLNWNNLNMKSFVVGGIKKGETPEQAAKRELQEETGYYNIKTIKLLGDKFITEFYSKPRGVNRKALVQGIFIKLANNKQVKQQLEAHEKFNLTWLTFDEVEKEVRSEDLKILWNEFLKLQKNDVLEKEATKKEDFIFNQSWPKYNPKMIQDESVKMVIQINGKVRDKMQVSADISEEKAKEKALQSEKIKQYTDGKEIKKVIFVKGRLISIVV